MKVKKGFELRDVCGEKVIVAHGIENIDFSHLISLNESAAYLWEQLAALPSFTEADAVEALTREYEVDPDTARKDSHEILQAWCEQGLVEA